MHACVGCPQLTLQLVELKEFCERPKNPTHMTMLCQITVSGCGFQRLHNSNSTRGSMGRRSNWGRVRYQGQSWPCRVPKLAVIVVMGIGLGLIAGTHDFLPANPPLEVLEGSLL